MKINKTFLIISGFLMTLSVSAFTQNGETIVTEDVKYTVGGMDFQGYLAYDSAVKGTRPGIIVVHEWTGLNDYAKFRARELAKQGYVAFAADMYGGGKEVPVSEARSMSGKVGSDFPLIKERFTAALDVLESNAMVDNTKVAAIGYCFGGGIVLNAARMGVELQGIASFHASINTGLDAGKGDVKTPLLVLQGAGDPAAPPQKQEAFRKEMNSAGANYEYVIYPDVNAHNFTNPEGSSYYPEEAEDAWGKMLDFFQEIF
ncbi:dienelactone hydrolase family protein [Oceanispirochaeta crateris]|uniref:Dienelactone hydrolase family protein n=1 Tax=Oceanispirochaeta crateris TaxID=2518645 RepID=A0A5C1QK67_9SPIO|nr:dienelactone hydrolase family protein [Oceanispirochaeta crateris]QEN06542.1 dienelactone hydrolase family protein [Oceanispirochaeta crateris]